MTATAEDILNFWFAEISTKQWWSKDPAFDQLVEQRFQSTLEAAGRGELFRWRESGDGRLAEIIVLDQFSRNIYRDTVRAFSQDPQALTLAQEAVRQNLHRQLPAVQQPFLLLPFMHSESAVIHAQAVELFHTPELEDNYRFELRHKAIIDRFGRYPHRNAILGRTSSAEELAFLQQPGSAF